MSDQAALAVPEVISKQKQKLLSAEVARERYEYNPFTGDIRYRIRVSSSRKAGDLVGTWSGKNRSVHLLSFAGKRYVVPRVIWLMQIGEWPKHEVDHKDRDRKNERWTNLRDATRAQNGYNRDLKRKNKHGYRGVVQQSQFPGRRTFRFSAKIMVRGKCLCIGRFDTAEEAALAYDVAARKHHGEFARLNFDAR